MSMSDIIIIIIIIIIFAALIHCPVTGNYEPKPRLPGQ